MARGCSSLDATCPVSRAIGVFQEKWVLHIVHALLGGPRGFNELGREVGGCNPTTLAGRLARLEELGLVERRLECDGGRSAYGLTDAGDALRDVIEAFRAWSSAHLGEDGVAHGMPVEMPQGEQARVTHPAVDAAVPPHATLRRSRIRAGDDRAEPQVYRTSEIGSSGG